MGIGLAGLLSPVSPDVLFSCSIPGVNKDGICSYNSAAAAALAAARLALTAKEYIIVPCKADVSVRQASVSAWGTGSCPLGYDAKRPTSLKVYPNVTLPSTLSLLTPQKLLWIFMKNTGLVFLLQTNFWLYQALEAEEQALQHGVQAQLPPYPDVCQQLVKSCWSSLRELLTALTRSEIKHAINRHASSRVAWKVLKDPRESLNRKALFYFSTPRWQLPPMYINTMLRTQLPMYAAEFIVACAYDTFDEARRLLRCKKQQQQKQQQQQHSEGVVPAELLSPHEQEQPGVLQQLQCQLQDVVSSSTQVTMSDVTYVTRRWLLRAGKHLVRVTMTALCAAAGAGIAGALAPRDRAGSWAVRGHIVTDLIVANLMMVVLDGGVSLSFHSMHGHEEHQQPH